MSKTKKTTKIATFLGWTFSLPHEIHLVDGKEFFELGERWEDDLRNDNSHWCDGAMTSAGIVSAVNTFTTPLPGQKVVLRKNVGKGSWGKCPWVMTNLG